MNNKFVYTSEDDKCYGLTGMIISLNVLEYDSMLQSISLDNTDGESISFTPDFYFCSNPRYSAKIAWNEMIKQYQLLVALLTGNIICRYRVGQQKQLTAADLTDMQAMVEDEGRDACSLEDDEIKTVFDKTVQYLNSVYNNRQIHNIARGLVEVIKSRRTMTGDEVMDELQYLRRH